MIKFLKEWLPLIVVILLILLSRVFIWDSVKVDGPSMDPTLANGNRLIMLRVGGIERGDVVVAQETLNQTLKNDPMATSGKTIVKRVVGMPGDILVFKADTLTINGKIYSQPWLEDYKSQFVNGKLANTYLTGSSMSNLTTADRQFFADTATTSKAFTVDNSGNPDFTLTVPEGRYFLMGDDRIVSADSRLVGTFTKSQLKGKVIFRFLPFNKIGTIQ
ncbi:signal peptidase I [Lactovum miscens]|uniref:Signal peptidase I n=1 Tax=Lactovum miscens TaxID=190387 RepID=A0A841CA20_9LACT|nr:signal peptidase I [Lactovum miscens]MBB5888411.1 signal peptidase I [Lactovum miscens]